MKVVIAGSAKKQEEIKKWIEFWEGKDGHVVLDYPKIIPENNFEKLYPDIHKNYFRNIIKSDVLFIANYDKGEVNGYIGAETFAELGFGLARKLVHGHDIKLILAKMPAKNVACYDEIVLWRNLGWIDQILTEGSSI